MSMSNQLSQSNLSNIHSHRELVETLEQLEAEEFNLNNSLDILLNSASRLEEPLTKIDQLQPLLASLTNDASTLNEVIAERAAIADRISSKVRLLDLEQNRLKDCIHRVQTLAELRDAFANLFKAIENRDWEAATRHFQRANATSPDLLTSQFAQAVVPSADVPDPPSIALENFANQLTTIFLAAFNTASSTKDEAATTRFFKLFPLLGPSSSESGLSAYSDFVKTLIILPPYPRGSQAKPCLPQLTSLFEQLALIIDQHQPIVDKYYGPRSMLAVVLKLHNELDRHTARILSAWNEDRAPHRKLSEVQNYNFPYLSQLSTNSTSAAAATSYGNSTNSPIGLQGSLRSFAGNVQRSYNLQPSLNAISSSSIGGNNLPLGNPVQVDGEVPDPKIIDGVIAEVAGMSSRWQTYRRFLHSRFASDYGSSSSSSKEEQKEEVPNHGQSDEHRALLEATEFRNSIDTLLKTLYSPLELSYLRLNIEKSHIADEVDNASSPILSSALDDTFFVVKKVVNRIVSLGHLESLKHLVEQVGEIVVRDFGEVLRGRLDSIGSFTSGGGFGIGTVSKVGGEGKEKREKNIINTYIVYLNDLDMASEYVVKLVEEIVAGDALLNSFFLRREIDEARATLLDLKLSHSKFASLKKAGLEQLFNQLIRPKIRPLISECFKDLSYCLDEDRYADVEAQDIFRKRFVRAWEALMEPYKTLLTQANFHHIFVTTLNTLSRPWETQLRTMKFTSLGTLQYDRDLRSVSSYLSNQTSFAISTINEAFIRLRQIALVLGFEEEEQEEMGRDFFAQGVGGEVNWTLSGQEIRAVLALKVAGT